MMACAAFAAPHSIVLNVHPALKIISLRENVKQEVTSTVIDEFKRPVPNVYLTITVETPPSTLQYARLTDPDGTDHLRIPLLDIGQYTASVNAKNPVNK